MNVQEDMVTRAVTKVVDGGTSIVVYQAKSGWPVERAVHVGIVHLDENGFGVRSVIPFLLDGPDRGSECINPFGCFMEELVVFIPNLLVLLSLVERDDLVRVCIPSAFLGLALHVGGFVLVPILVWSLRAPEAVKIVIGDVFIQGNLELAVGCSVSRHRIVDGGNCERQVG